MAINVYMTLFRKYNAQQLKTLEWKYNLMCYGLTFLIALVYLFIETKSRGKMYGPATVRTRKLAICIVYIANQNSSSGVGSILNG